MAAHKKSAKKRKPVPRHTRKYQFRNNHPIDQHVESILDFWKTGKQEITNLRKAVSLYYALEQGNLDVLFETFPQYRNQFTPISDQLVEQFMQILIQQTPKMGEKHTQLLPLQEPPKILAPIVKQVTSVSAETIADNFLSMFE